MQWTELLLVTPKKTSGRMGRAYAYVAETRPNGPARPDLEDGDEVMQKGYCDNNTHVRIGFGEAAGAIRP